MIGRLYSIGFFDMVEPIFYSSFATPHLGVQYFGAFSLFVNTFGSIFIGRSGKDLFIRSPILVALAEPKGPYFKGLKLFHKRCALANIRHDRTVAFYTSYMTTKSPFKEWDKTCLSYLPATSIRVNDESVEPKILDLKNSKLLPEPQKHTPTFQARLKYFGILVLIGFILPLWVPLVFTANSFGSVLSWFRLRFFHHGYDVESGWKSVKDALSKGAASASTPGDNSNVSSTNVISKELALFTEEVIEGVLDATERQDDLSEEEETEDPIDGDLKNLKIGGLGDLVAVDFKKLEANTKELMSIFEEKESAYPIFQDSPSLDLDQDRLTINENLNSLQWYKVPVYVDVFNAHDGIIARRGLRSSHRGLAGIYLWVGIVQNVLKEERK